MHISPKNFVLLLSKGNCGKHSHVQSHHHYHNHLRPVVMANPPESGSEKQQNLALVCEC